MAINGNDNSSGARTSGGASAMMSSQFRGNVQDNSRSVGAEKPSTWRCYKCGKEGHIKCENTTKKKTHKAKTMMQRIRLQVPLSPGRQTRLTDHKVEWVIDSGASKHMTCDKELQDHQQFTEAQSVKLGDIQFNSIKLY